MALTTALTAVGAGLNAAGTLGSASAQQQAGAAQQQAANYKAAQEDQQATQAIAASQQQMFDQQRKTDLLQSTLQARSAADGGMATDAGVLSLGQDIAGRGEMLKLDDLWQGQSKAAGLRTQAQADRYSGIIAKKGADMAATGTLLSGAGSMFSRFGGLDKQQGLSF